ncbi:prephenate dehydrogenase/arogenate dehydrogenase family protein [Salmonella enterica]|nr:prephenate dehydrogenase/arogenate dehydrogenase family protein [Salmonella enterica]
MKNIGFLGLGVMGLPMAINLVKKSELQVIGYDVNEERTRLLKKQGGFSETDPELIFRKCDIIFLCMPTNEILAENVRAIINHSTPGTIVIDLGSTSPVVISRLYDETRDKDIHLIDSPVSGGEIGAINGSLVLMCGGDKSIFEKVKSLLFLLGNIVTYMGGSGCGSVAKLANNMIVACNIAAVAEAFSFAVKAGINPGTLFNAIKDGFAGSKIMNIKIPKIISGDFTPSARIAIHMKDLKNAKLLAQAMGVDIPLSNEVLGFMQELDDNGLANEDHCAIIRIYEDKMGVQVRLQPEEKEL